MFLRFRAVAVACLIAISLAVSLSPATAAFKIADRVRQTTTTTGTGTLTLISPASIDRSFASAIGVGNTTYYTEDDGVGDWEIGIGTVGTSTLTRDTVLRSSNSNALVNFPAGTKTVIVNVPADRFLYMCSAGLSPSVGDVLVFDGGCWTNNPGSTALATARTNLGAAAAATSVQNSRTITCGTALTGCGNLSADRTLSVSVGTGSGTVAAGNDSRITGAAQKSSNLSDLSNKATAQATLGISTATSSDYTITAGGLITFNHGLTGNTWFRYQLVVQTAVDGFSVGQIIDVYPSGTQTNNGNEGPSFLAYESGTTLRLRFNADVSNRMFTFINRDTGSFSISFIEASDVKMRITAFAINPSP